MTSSLYTAQDARYDRIISNARKRGESDTLNFVLERIKFAANLTNEVHGVTLSKELSLKLVKDLETLGYTIIPQLLGDYRILWKEKQEPELPEAKAQLIKTNIGVKSK